MASPDFDLEGHRGARGLCPENTLPSFEAAFDAGATSIETDIMLTRDGVAVLIHDPALSDAIMRLPAGSPAPCPRTRPAVRSLTLEQLRHYRADGNPDPARFPEQRAGVPPLARLFAEQRGFDPYVVPTVSELIAFAAAYAGELGAQAGKTPEQRARVAHMHFDFELKRLPFRPETIGDGFAGQDASLLEQTVAGLIADAGVAERTIVRSFDHRCIHALGRLLPKLMTAILVSGTALRHPGSVARQAGSGAFCPDYQFLDEAQVREAHAEGVRVIPWTVNDPADWQRLLDWGVDGITTDYPDRLAKFLGP